MAETEIKCFSEEEFEFAKWFQVQHAWKKIKCTSYKPSEDKPIHHYFLINLRTKKELYISFSPFSIICSLIVKNMFGKEKLKDIYVGKKWNECLIKMEEWWLNV